eukprot:1097445-Pleurochrysis_carterae.AAC.1
MSGTWNAENGSRSADSGCCAMRSQNFLHAGTTAAVRWTAPSPSSSEISSLERDSSLSSRGMDRGVQIWFGLSRRASPRERRSWAS